MARGAPRLDTVPGQPAGRQEFMVARELSRFAIRPIAALKKDGRNAFVVRLVVTALAAKLDQAGVGRSFHAAKHWVKPPR
jgi:hypothetical protein